MDLRNKYFFAVKMNNRTLYWLKSLAILLSVFTVEVSAYKTCSQPPYAPAGQYAGRDQECAALVQTKCPGVGLTSTWRRGIKVKDNCSTLPSYIAIATFEGPNNTYNTPGARKQHTAIFASCDATGITVKHFRTTEFFQCHYNYHY